MLSSVCLHNFLVCNGLLNDDLEMARRTVFQLQEIQPGAGFKTGDFVKEKLGGLPLTDSFEVDSTSRVSQSISPIRSMVEGVHPVSCRSNSTSRRCGGGRAQVHNHDKASLGTIVWVVPARAPSQPWLLLLGRVNL